MKVVVDAGTEKPTVDECMYHRCWDHRFVEQFNSSEHSGAECGACIRGEQCATHPLSRMEWACVTCLEQSLDKLRLELDMERGVLAMTVARLGGTVEDMPTHRGNFLQRIDELRAIERGDRIKEHPPGKLGIPGCCFKD